MRQFTEDKLKEIMGSMPYSGSLRNHTRGEDFESYFLSWMDGLKRNIEEAVEGAKEDRAKLDRLERALYGVNQFVEIIKEIGDGK